MDIMDMVDVISAEAIKEQEIQEAEDRVITAGKYEGLVISWNKVEENDKGTDVTFQGVPLYKAFIKFFDCPEYGKSRAGWFKLTTAKVVGVNGRPKTAYTAAVGLVKATGLADTAFSEVLEQAKVTRVRYDVGLFESEEGKKYNFLRGVKALA